MQRNGITPVFPTTPPRLTAPRLAGVLVGLLGLALGSGGLLGLDFAATRAAGAQLSGITLPWLLIAICVCFFGATQRLPPAPWQRRASIAGIAVVLALALADLFSALTRHPLGIEDAGLGFVLVAVAFWLARSPLGGRRLKAYLALTLAVALIGLGGLAGHFLRLEVLYGVADDSGLHLPAAFALAVTAAGLWLLQAPPGADSDAVGKTDQRIQRRSVVVITLAAISAGVAGFAVMRDTFEQTISQGLLLTASTSATSLARAVEVSTWFPRTVATRTMVVSSLGRLSKDPADPASREFLQRVAANLLTAELACVQFFAADGQLVGMAGAPVREQARVRHPLRIPGQTAQLIWHGGYALVTENAVIHEGRAVGQLVIEQRLPLFDQLFAELRAANASSDASLCSRRADHAVCGPTRTQREGFELPMLGAGGVPAAPVSRALLGERGVAVVRGGPGTPVVAAFAPITGLGLGLAVQTGLDAFYAPLRARIGALAAVLLVIIALALYAQRSQVRPVLKRLVDSEQRIKAIVEEQSELISLARPGGELVYANPAYARHYGHTPAEMIGTNLFDHVDPADRAAVRDTIERVLRSGNAETTENRILYREGGECWATWTNTVQRDADGRPLLHSVGRDITARKRAEAALSESRRQLAERERFLRDITDHVPALVTHIDRDERYTFANAQFAVWLGMDPATMVGRTVRELRPELYDSRLGPHIRAALAGQPSAFEDTAIIAGQPLHCRVSYVPDIGADGSVRGCYALTVDISAARAAEQAALAARRDTDRLAAVLTSIADLTPAALSMVDNELIYRFVNSRFERWIGRSRSEVLGRPASEILKPDDFAASLPFARRALEGEEVRFERTEEHDGVVRHIQLSYLPLREPGGEVSGFVGVAQDVTEHREETNRFRRLSERDPLTGLLNRAGFESALESMMADGAGPRMAVLYLDLDRFKPINDTLGHAAGDEALQCFAQRLTGAVRPTDRVARIGGDEFAIVLDTVPNADTARAIARKIIAMVQEPMTLTQGVVEVGTSIGLAYGLGSGETWRQFVARADAALFAAKRAGRGRVEQLDA